MLWSSLSAWFQGGTPHSDSAEQSARQMEVDKEPAVQYEHDAVELQAVCRQHPSTASSSHSQGINIPPRQTNIPEEAVVVLGGWFYNYSPKDCVLISPLSRYKQQQASANTL
jgi:hypothetical protein